MKPLALILILMWLLALTLIIMWFVFQLVWYLNLRNTILSFYEYSFVLTVPYTYVRIQHLNIVLFIPGLHLWSAQTLYLDKKEAKQAKNELATSFICNRVWLVQQTMVEINLDLEFYTHAAFQYVYHRFLLEYTKGSGKAECKRKVLEDETQQKSDYSYEINNSALLFLWVECEPKVLGIYFYFLSILPGLFLFFEHSTWQY